MSVAVQIFRLDLSESALARDFAVLDARERARAEEIRVRAACKRFIAAHGALRITLAAVTGRAPDSLTFMRTPSGKPYLSDAGTPHPLQFSLSTAGGYVALAWSYEGEVGIDIEFPRPRVTADLGAVAAHVLGGGEQRYWRGLASSERIAAFYRLWTRKEALAKASGAGFSIPPASIPALESKTWRGFTVRDLETPRGLVGALAAA